jgi:arginine N-succinyltransferase
VNLPNDPDRLRQIVDRSTKAFAGSLPPAERDLVFVLEERSGTDGSARVVGCSMLFAQHGNRRAPHVYFDVLDEQRYSETIDRHFHHRVLRIGYNYEGLTEIGGLVLLPRLRGHPAQLGKLLSYVRFLYIALHRSWFRDEIVSELMPPLEADGTSLLWEALGRNFTALGYQEADRLSRENKEFIRALFPQEPIYACLLPARAQALIGEVGPATKGVEKMLRRIGFRFANRIDPFDGGPHFHARTDEVTLVRAARRLRAIGEVGDAAPEGQVRSAIVCVDRPEPPFFVALPAQAFVTEDGVSLGPADRAALGVSPGELVGVLPLEDAPT